MAAICNCNNGLSNVGLPNCVPIASVTKKLILVPLFANDGTRNEYNVSALTFNQAFFDARINDTDASKRWFVLQDVENVEDVRADAIFETLNNGKNIFIQQGVRSFTGVLINGSSEQLYKLESGACVNFGILVVDKNGNLIGNGLSKAGYLRPIKVDKNTWVPTLVKSTDTTVQKIQLKFEWDITEEDKNLKMISADDITISLLDLAGLVDIYGGTPSSISTTGFTIQLKTFYGSMKNPVVVQGLLLADFSLYNETDALAVTISSVTESPAGTYAFTFAAQTSADVLELRISKNGFDDAFLNDVTITIP